MDVETCLQALQQHLIDPHGTTTSTTKAEPNTPLPLADITTGLDAWNNSAEFVLEARSGYGHAKPKVPGMEWANQRRVDLVHAIRKAFLGVSYVALIRPRVVNQENQEREQEEEDLDLDYDGFADGLGRILIMLDENNNTEHQEELDISTVELLMPYVPWSSNQMSNDDELLISLIPELLRAIKNVIRLHNTFWEAKDNNNHAVSPLSAFLSTGMIRLYLTLYGTSNLGNSHLFPSTYSNNNNSIIEEQSVSMVSFQTSRYAGIILVHCLRCTHHPSSALPTPSDICCSQDLASAVVAQLMHPANPVPHMLVTVRLLNHMLGYATRPPVILNNVNAALKRHYEGQGQTEEGECIYQDVTSVLVATLAWTVRGATSAFALPPVQNEKSQSQQQIPDYNQDAQHDAENDNNNNINDEDDRTVELTQDLLHLLFSIHATRHPQTQTPPSAEQTTTMTQLGILLCDILTHAPHANLQIYQVKLAVVQLLMEGPSSYGRYLLVNGGMYALLEILELQLVSVVVEQQTQQGGSDVQRLAPLLVCLTRFAKEDGRVRQVILDHIFPPSKDDEEEEGKQHEDDNIHNNDASGTMDPTKQPMKPKDAPPGTIRYYLIQLLTWQDRNTTTTATSSSPNHYTSSIKRLAGEFLWTLCHENAQEFVRRTGFGNAVWMLGVKGLVQLPTTTTTTTTTTTGLGQG